PRLTSTRGSNTGQVTLSTGASGVAASSAPSPDASTTTTVASTAAGTTQRGAIRANSSHTITTGSPSAGNCTAASTGAMQIGNRMPASIALAMGFGMRVTARASAGQRPVTSSSTPHSTNAPTAARKSPVVASAATSTAAPGVDQAKLSGIRNHRPSTIASTP